MESLARGSRILLFCIVFTYSKVNNCLEISQSTALRIKAAIDRFEQDHKVCLQREWPPIHVNQIPMVQEYSTPPILLWDVLKSYAGVVKSLPCPFCERNGHSDLLVRCGIWTDGTTKSSYTPRIIFDTSSVILLVSGVYTCSNNHQVPSHNPKILASLPSAVHIPFLLTNRNGFSMELISEICSLVDHGLSFLGIEDIIREQFQHSYFRLRSRYEQDAQHVAKSKLIDFPEFDQSSFPFPHVKAIREVFASYSSLFEQLFHDDMTSRTSDWIFCDHTFKSAANIGFIRESDGKWIKLFKCIFIVLGKGRDILHWRFTRGESFGEVRDIFIQLKDRLQANGVKLRGVVIDNCCKWQRGLAAIFPDIAIKLDLFHAVQRFLKTLPGCTRIGSGIAKEYGLIFRRPSDLGEKRTQPTVDKETMLKNLEGFQTKWSYKRWNNNVILNIEAKKALQNIKSHIERGCLSDIPVQCSTSGNERIHRHMNSVLHTNRIGLDLAYHRCARFFFRINNGDKGELTSKLCHPRILENHYFSENFGVSKNVSISDGSTALLKLDSEKNGSLETYFSSHIDYIKDVIKSFITNSNSIEDHLYCSTHHSALQIALDAINYYQVYEGLRSLGGSRYISKSRLPSSIGLENISVMKIRRLTESSAEHDLAQNDKTLTAHVQGFGLSIVPVPGDGNCFFSTVAFHLSNLLTATSPHMDVVNHLSSLGLTADMEITELANALRELVVEEWTGPNAEEYMNFIDSEVNFYSEVSKYRTPGYFHGPLGDLMPIAMSNVLNLPMCIITSESHTPVISICPRQAVTGSVPIMLAYTSSGPGHYDAIATTKQLNNDTG